VLTVTLTPPLYAGELRAWLAQGWQNTSLTAWARVYGLADSTRLGYLQAIRRYLTFLRGKPLDSTDSIIEYGYRNVEIGLWVSHAAGRYLGRLISALVWLKLKTPDLTKAVKMRWLHAAFMRLRASRGIQSRPPLTHRQLHDICDIIRMTVRAEQASCVVALLMAAFWGMMRSKELWRLSSTMTEWSIDKQGQLTMVACYRDKTHQAANRKVVVAFPAEDRGLAEALLARSQADRENRRGKHPLLLPSERAAVQQAFRDVGTCPGSIRPGGNMFWLQAGLARALIHKQGGWAQGSKIPALHYTAVNGATIATLREKAAKGMKR